jgi:hypothetical protein
LENENHLVLDTSKFHDSQRIRLYLSNICALQWDVTINVFDTNTAVMTICVFHVALIKGIFGWTKSIHGFLANIRYPSICSLNQAPDYASIPDFWYDRIKSAYGYLQGTTPTDAPNALFKYDFLLNDIYVILMHDVMIGTSVRCILHFTKMYPSNGTQRNNSL